MTDVTIEDNGLISVTLKHGNQSSSVDVDPLVEFENLSRIYRECVAPENYESEPGTQEAREYAAQVNDFYRAAADYLQELFGLDRVSLDAASRYWESMVIRQDELKKNTDDWLVSLISTDSTPQSSAEKPSPAST